MSFTDNLVGAIVIVFIVIAVFAFSSSRLVKEEIKEVKGWQSEYTDDYYSTSMDAFLNLAPENMTKTYNLIIGDFISNAKEISTDGGKVLVLEKEMEQSLDGIYGKNNYYMSIKPKFTNLRMSFIIDGSESLEDERLYLAKEISGLVTDLEQNVFKNEVRIDAKIYILGEGSNLCNGFGSECKTISNNFLYGENNNIILPPTFGFSSYDAWLASNPAALPVDFARSDWMAGMAAVNGEFLKDPNSKNSLHIMIPISDELSTSSEADECYKISKSIGETTSKINYITCGLCLDKCPVERSMRNYKEFNDTIRKYGMTIIIPISSFDDSYDYDNTINNLFVTSYAKQFSPSCTSNLACQGSILCDDSKYQCKACTCTDCSDPAKRKVGRFKECRDDVGKQMDTLAKDFKGVMIDIKDLEELKSKLKDAIDKSISELALEVGKYNESRTRYVYRRILSLPNKNSADILLVVYENPFDDDTTIERPEKGWVDIRLIYPIPNSFIYNKDKIILNISTNHPATCECAIAKSPAVPSTMFKMSTNDDLYHKSGELSVSNGKYTVRCTCIGLSEYYNIPNTIEKSFTVSDKLCEENGGEICPIDKACRTDFMTELNPRCCMTGCTSCAEMNGKICDPNVPCQGDKWAKGIDRCCLAPVCGTCESKGYGTCKPDQVCVGGSDQVKKDFGTSCCSGTCNPCSEMGTDYVLENGICKLKKAQLQILFVPVNWEGTMEQFDSFADNQYSAVIENIPLKNCPDRVRVIKSHANCQINFGDCSEGYKVSAIFKIRECADKYGVDYNFVTGLGDPKVCGRTVGWTLGPSTPVAFSMYTYKYVTIHEMGHTWGLNDEYVDACRCRVGLIDDSTNCLKTEFDGSDPAGGYTSDYCAGGTLCAGYTVTCMGNKNDKLGRDIMSYAGAPEPAFAKPSWDHILTVPKLQCS